MQNWEAVQAQLLAMFRRQRAIKHYQGRMIRSLRLQAQQWSYSQMVRRYCFQMVVVRDWYSTSRRIAQRSTRFWLGGSNFSSYMGLKVMDDREYDGGVIDAMGEQR